VDVFSTGCRQEGHPTSKSPDQFPLMECTFLPLLFLHYRPFSSLRRTWWDGGKEDVCRGRVKGELGESGWSARLIAKAKVLLEQLVAACTVYIRVLKSSITCYVQVEQKSVCCDRQRHVDDSHDYVSLNVCLNVCLLVLLDVWLSSSVCELPDKQTPRDTLDLDLHL